MPTVPRYDQNAAPTTPLPGARVSTQAPAGAFGGQPQSVDLGGFAKNVAGIIEEERRKADQVILLEADNKLADLEKSLLYDPEKGVLNKRGRDALSAPEDVSSGWGKGISKIERELANESQQLAFRNRVQSRWHSLGVTVQRHVAAESHQHENDQATSALANRYDTAITRSGDPAEVEKAVTETRAIMGDYARRNGWSPEQLQERSRTAVSRIHAGIIEQMLAAGGDRDALAYFDGARSEISGDQIPEIARRLDQASTDGTAARAADGVWRSLGPKSLTDPVRASTMEQALRDAIGDDPKVVRAAIAELRARASAFNAEQTETAAANKAALLGAFNQGAGLSSIKKRTEYRALSGTDQESLSAYIEGRSIQTTERAEAELTSKQFGAYWRLSSAGALSSMSENTILSLEPSLGQRLVGQLMQQKRALSANSAEAGSRVIEARIDEDMFKVLANEAGLRPYDKSPTKEWAEDLGRMKVAVELEIARSQEKARRPLTQSEKRDVMQRLLDQKVMQETGMLSWGNWGADRPVIASTISRDEDGKLPTNIRVPLAKIPADYTQQALNWMRSEGLIRRDHSDRRALGSVGARIERAYAARLAGATWNEIEEILRPSTESPWLPSLGEAAKTSIETYGAVAKITRDVIITRDLNGAVAREIQREDAAAVKKVPPDK